MARRQFEAHTRPPRVLLLGYEPEVRALLHTVLEDEGLLPLDEETDSQARRSADVALLEVPLDAGSRPDLVCLRETVRRLAPAPCVLFTSRTILTSEVARQVGAAAVIPEFDKQRLVYVLLGAALNLLR